MTNEEKAQRMCETITSIYDVSLGQEIQIHKAVLEAMQWKDQQFERSQDIAIGCLFSYFKAQGNSEDAINNFINAIKSQVNAEVELCHQEEK